MPHTISIHAAREGGDYGFRLAVTPRKRFQSTPPVKAATTHYKLQYGIKQFQSTPPVKAATFAFRFKCGHGFNFNPRRP